MLLRETRLWARHAIQLTSKVILESFSEVRDDWFLKIFGTDRHWSLIIAAMNCVDLLLGVDIGQK